MANHFLKRREICKYFFCKKHAKLAYLWILDPKISSFVGTVPPTTHKVASKEAWEGSIEETIEVKNLTISIHGNTKCFIGKCIEVTWKGIKNRIMQKIFPENLEDVEVYINIQWSRMHSIRSKFLVIRYEAVIEWIITHMEESCFVVKVEVRSQTIM